MTQFYSRIDTEFNGDVYNIPFSYSKESEISVYLDEELFTGWYFLNESQIKFTELPSETPEIVSIRRTTDITKKVVEYTNNTMLSKEALNLSQDQLLNAIQEIYDNTIVFELDSTNQIATNKADTDAQIEANKQDTDNQIAAFEANINATIAEVTEAAEKINELEEAVNTATTSAENAESAANNAQNSANTASQLVQEAQETLTTRADVDLSNLSIIGQSILDNKANIDLSNLTEAGEKHFINKQQITNCLLEVPQNINVELADGVLTLKAGSKVIVPNGFEEDGTTLKFDEIEIQTDVSGTHTGNLGASFVYYVEATNSLVFSAVNNTNSGTTPPESDAVYYNTSTNTIYYIDSNGVIADKRSYPLGIVQRTGSISSIDQVFNGMGYIGSTIWVAKGVKGLIPNGRNEDGTLNNIEKTLEQDSVRIMDEAEGSYFMFWYEDLDFCSGWGGQYVISENQPLTWEGQYVMWYNPATNLYKRSDNGGDYYTTQVVYMGKLIKADGASIALFEPVQPFRAVNYSEYLDTPRVIETYVNGYSGYRIWAPDQTGRKRCQQWGAITDASGGEKYITFLKPFADATYFIVRNVGSSYSSSSLARFESCYYLTATGFTTYYTTDYNQPQNNRWYADGYID